MPLAYSVAWHGIALNLSLETAHHMKYSVPDSGIIETIRDR